MNHNPIDRGSATRLVKNSQFDFSALSDPRAQHLIKYKMSGLLGLIIAGFAAGQDTLRDIETFAWLLANRAKKHLGLRAKDSPSDTTIYNLLCRLDPMGFRNALVDQVTKAVKRKEITNDLFAGGVVAFDGKGGISDWGYAPNDSAKQTICENPLTPLWYLYCQRVHLVSCSARPCLDQEFIESKKGEATIFAEVFPRVLQAYQRLFSIVTGDAAYMSRKNAQLVLDAEKYYLFGLKENQKRLYNLALDHLRDKPIEAEYFERYQGKDIHRALFRAPCPEGTDFPGATQFLAVVDTTFTDDGQKTVETRLFITCISYEKYSAKALLKLVRLHWGIENNGNWTLDQQFDDDVRSPCKQGNGSLVVSWLRLLAFNLVAINRSLFPKHDKGKPPSWKQTKCFLYALFISWKVGSFTRD